MTIDDAEDAAKDAVGTSVNLNHLDLICSKRPLTVLISHCLFLASTAS